MNAPVLWTEKYRPKTIDECILPENLKNTFNEMISTSSIPNLLLCGSPGTGKTTVARALMNQTNAEYIFLNGSLNVNIDKIRTDITEFASSVSFTGGRKFVIIDEADNLSVTHVQPSLRSFIEQFANNCGFIFTCNYKQKLIEPLHSRFSVVDFKFDKATKLALAKIFFKRLQQILNEEKVAFDKAVLGEIVSKWFPDSRKILNELQRYGASGSIDSGILSTFSDSTFNTLIAHIRDKDFTAIRKWITVNDVDETMFYTAMYKAGVNSCDAVNLAQLILILSKYSYQHNFCVDPEINITACLVEIMIEIQFR